MASGAFCCRRSATPPEERAAVVCCGEPRHCGQHVCAPDHAESNVRFWNAGQQALRSREWAQTEG